MTIKLQAVTKPTTYGQGGDTVYIIKIEPELANYHYMSLAREK